MLAIAVQMIFSLSLAFAIGYFTAWIIRGMRERDRFEKFFGNWRARYTQIERDLDLRVAQVHAAQKELAQAQATLGEREVAYAESEARRKAMSAQLAEYDRRLREMEAEREGRSAELARLTSEDSAVDLTQMRKKRV